VKKVLIVTAHRLNRAPNQRFRFEQYLDFLKSNGFECEVSFLLDEKADAVFYKPGHLLNKLSILVKSIFIRWKDVQRAKQFDLIFICREAFLTGTTYFEKKLVASGVPVIYDFDDAIWHFDVSEANKKFGWLKNPEKTSKIIGMADLIFAGNQYLANYASQYNKNVTIIPTTIDLNDYKQVPFKNPDVICIGWSGSITTIRHFEMAVPFLKVLKAKYGDKIKIKVIGDSSYRNDELSIEGIAWKKETELAELSEIDIGIMPLPDDEWAKGKCGLKGLQYMALGMATIMSPVGVNSEIIQDGENGMLASEVDEWVEKISMLIDDATLREKCAANGRKTVEEKYSVEAIKADYFKHFTFLTAQKK
jgi:glycosyltransferase involved in cell wall biosynthesis